MAAKVYWGSGYQGGHNNKLYAFGLPAGARHPYIGSDGGSAMMVR